MDIQRHGGNNIREKTSGCMVSGKDHGNCLYPCLKYIYLLQIMDKLSFHKDRHN